MLLIAGPSCSGKTELARHLQQILPDPWLFWEADRMQPAFPRGNEFADRTTEGRMLGANLATIRAYLDSEFNVIAELGIWYPEAMAAASAVFSGIDVAVVALECDLAELERRERARGTTYLGTAKSQYDSMSDLRSNLVLDSASLSTHDLGDQVVEWLEKGEAGVGLL